MDTIIPIPGQLPEDWHTQHRQECGTQYRGCHPQCKKRIYEETGIWVKEFIDLSKFSNNKELAEYILRHGG